MLRRVILCIVKAEFATAMPGDVGRMPATAQQRRWLTMMSSGSLETLGSLVDHAGFLEVLLVAWLMAIAPAHRGKFIGAADSLAKILVTAHVRVATLLS